MIKLGEKIFRSIQGEGDLTGRLSIWVRFGGCNLRCPGFFQPDPMDKLNWHQPLELSPKDYKTLEELPVIPYGCDSLYSIDPKFKHLWINYPEAKDLVEDINKLLYDKQWIHPLTKNPIDLCFTGGEPMLQQQAIVDILLEVGEKLPKIQIETNGTQPIRQLTQLKEQHPTIDLHLNISPKLHSVSGEKEAVKYNRIYDYQENLSKFGILKFVVNGTEKSWDELNTHVIQLRDTGVNYPIYVMPVGATKEQQEDHSVISKIANRAISEGYNVSGRLHAIVFGNGIGT